MQENFKPLPHVTVRVRQPREPEFVAVDIHPRAPMPRDARNSMTMRDVFAAAAMEGDWASQSEVNSGVFYNETSDVVLKQRADLFYRMADAMIAARTEKPAEKKEVAGVKFSTENSQSFWVRGSVDAFADYLSGILDMVEEASPDSNAEMGLGLREKLAERWQLLTEKERQVAERIGELINRGSDRVGG